MNPGEKFLSDEEYAALIEEIKNIYNIYFFILG